MFIRRRTQYRTREKGDTIVEVLIAISVVSMVLGGAYVTTNRSLLATRAAEERGNALKLAESQIEQLKGIANSNQADTIFGSGTPMPFCISGVSGAVVSATNPDCKVNAGGQPNTTQPVYSLSIVRGSDNNTFTVTNQWADASGKITDSLRLIYRVYE